VPFHRAECSLAGGLVDLLHAGQDRMAAFQRLDWDRALAWLRGRTGTDLAPEQEQAVRLALTERVAVLTGGPGCGKSFTVRSIVELARAKQAEIVLVAPTGGPPNGWLNSPATPLPPCTGCSSCSRAAIRSMTGTTRWTLTSWWWTSPP
jgi:hypothetical protein